MSEYREFTGKSVEEALRTAREEFGVGLDDLDFEILTSGSRGVLGMGAEPARIVAAPRSALGGAAPKREAAQSTPLPAPPAREERRFGDRDRDRDRDRGPRRDHRDGPPARFGDRDRPPRRDDRPPRRDDRGGFERGGQGDRPRTPSTFEPRTSPRPEGEPAAHREERGGRGGQFGGRGPRPDRGDRPRAGASDLSAREAAEVAAARGSLAAERAELEAAEATPEALEAGKAILEELMTRMGFDVRVELQTGETSRLNVVGDTEEKEALGALIGRKGERLSALQHLVNLMLSRKMGAWTRVLVDVEDYRGRRERQLREIATRAAERVGETGKMLQLEAMPALERRWIHLALRDHVAVVTQSIGEEPNRRVVILPRPE